MPNSKNKIYKYKVSSKDGGLRIDSLLAKVYPEFTRSYFRKIIDLNLVAINGKLAKPSHKSEGNDLIEFEIPLPEKIDTNPEKIELDVIYEDHDIIVINKAAGMVVHPAAGNYSGTLVNALLHHCKDLSGIGGELKPGIVHRLDKGTSGAIIAAKNDKAHLALSKQFKDREVKKIYYALVFGVPKEKSGIIDKPIGRHLKDRKKHSSITSKGRDAITEWKLKKAFDVGLSWLEIRLRTGRTHQIRVHLSEMRHPLVGDDVYGSARQVNRLQDINVRSIISEAKRPILHAYELEITHPTSNERMSFKAEFPEDIRTLLLELRA
ncbi:RluA family pseudouridine synthase [bacterium]|nr:RluA family pseudouridine synthase [bacterium]